MKRIVISVAILFALLSAATAQWNGCKAGFCNAKTASAPAYQGPGDIVSGALIWGSCARVYSLSLASTSTSMCDLVDSSTGTVAICTLRGSSSGFVDLAGSYCTGSTTPAAACSAAAGGSCRVSKVYDQIGGTSGWINATNSQRPILTFSALNGLPGLTSASASTTLLQTTSTFTQSLPFTWTGVAKRTSNFAIEQAIIGSSTYSGAIAFTSSASTVGVTGNASFLTLASVADSSFHAVIGLVDTSCTIAADGASNSGACSGLGMSTVPSRIMRESSGHTLDGVWMEGGLWPSGFTNPQIASMNSNIHGTNGYNFL